MPVPGAILQGAGGMLDQPIDTSGIARGAQIADERRNAQARLKLAKQSQLNQESNAFTEANDPTKLKGDVADAPVGQAMADINYEFQRRLLAGENAQSLKVELMPRMQQIAKYMTASKIIDANIEKTIAAMPKTGAYDFDKIRAEVKKQAYAGMLNPKTGKYDTSLIDKIDPTQNYIEKLIQEHPDLGTSMDVWDKMAKEIPKYKTADEYIEITGPGTSIKHRTTGLMNAFEDFVRDKNGKPIGIATQGDVYPERDKDGNIITDKNNNPKPVNDPDTDKPVMMLKEGKFEGLMSNRDLSDSLRGEAKRHFIAAGHPDVAENDPAFRDYMRHLAYQKLEQNKTSDFSAVHDPKESAGAATQEMMQDPQYWANERKKSRVATEERLNAENRDRAAHPEKYSDKTPRSATAEIISNIFTNPKSIVGGEIPTATPDGRQAYDITGGFPKIGPGYVKQFYDAKNHQLLLYKKDNSTPEIVTADNAGPFMTKVAMLNKENPASVKKVLTDTGYGAGEYKSGKSDELSVPIEKVEKESRDATTSARNTAIDNANLNTLKNQETPDGGTISKIERNRVFGPAYVVSILSKDGKSTQVKEFKTKEEFKDYMLTPEELADKYKSKK